LREVLARQGITSTSAVLATMLSGHAVTAAPVGLAASVAGTALASAATSTGAGLTFLKFMTMTKTQTAIVSALILAGVATPLVLQHQTQVQLRQKN
jgi:hypothetical protein